MASPTNKSGRNTGFGTNGSANDKGAGSIDRETKCPLLLRVFCASSRHNSLSDYNKGALKRRAYIENVPWTKNVVYQHATYLFILYFR